MKNISFIVNEAYNDNKIFDENDYTRKKYLKLKETLYQSGFNLNTYDKYKKNQADIALYLDIPHNIDIIIDDKLVNYALLIESPLISPINYKQSTHHHFKKIFTWDDEYIKTKNTVYEKVRYAFDLSTEYPPTDFAKKKLCSLIVSNKFSNHEDELYTRRRDVVRWFEQNHINEFDLFGRGWNTLRSNNSISNLVKKNALLNKYILSISNNYYPSYKGKVYCKYKALSNYKFTIAFENIFNKEGYITEKIFDAFFAGTVPIYLGANNIEKEIPSNCFIDMRNFINIKELYDFMKNISYTTYNNYLNNIKIFLDSKRAQKFSLTTFSTTITNIISHDN